MICGKCLLDGHTNCLQDRTPDVLAAGGICQPFTKARTKTGTGKSGAPAEHPGYHITLEVLPLLVDHRKPKIFLLEEVLEFGQKDKTTGIAPSDKLTQTLLASGHFTGTETVRELDVSSWNESSRGRMYMAYFSAEIGGQEAATKWRARCMRTHQSLAGRLPEPLLGGTLTHEEIETVRLMSLKQQAAFQTLHILISIFVLKFSLASSAQKLVDS